ncbi:hypothetical protein Acor_45060 [Acrocarpospora corrugata]|uniref:Uncharacterized protein n=1 Tax=Acrocarpospora corrugata TaxID=35763 RepID=A0A5M3W2G9_9ACTN|nr:hypothetical protein [Acrocarpospora corrugata]GES02440.1 hypothetical protein Acor_45060 [Acrocarpospora corrugata]
MVASETTPRPKTARSWFRCPAEPEQPSLTDGLEAAEAAGEFSCGACKTYQVPIRHIDELTRLSFHTFPDADPLTRNETAATIAREISHPRALPVP